MTTTYFRMTAVITGALVVAAAFTAFTSAASPRFYDDDPIWVEHDTQDAAAMKPLEVDLVVDLTYNMLAAAENSDVRAQNVNTVDEVPDSSWFTNRIGHRSMTATDIANGPNTTTGPAAGTWTVISSKSDGVTPGFTIRDATGQVWFLKFDPPGYRAMATGTEVAVTKLMWALGYNVPENHVAHMRREQLVVGDGAKFTPLAAKTRPMRLSDIDSLLARADREPEGSFRVVASKALQGRPIGRVRFYDTRSDDPNDIVPHEDRRELRGYGVFAAWLNHVDAKAINSLDMLVTDNGRSFVRHHLIDFGSSLGSGGVAPADHWAGHQYLLQPGDIARQMLGFGFHFPDWHTTKSYEAPSIGRLPQDSTGFNPILWKPRVPNRAFLHARADDNFWAAQKLVALTDEMLRAAVTTGEFNDPASEAFLVRALGERRDAIAQAYLTAVNPISDPVLDDSGTLTFRNAAVDAGVAQAPVTYRAAWSTFDNATGTGRPIAATSAATTRINAPAALPSTPGAFIKIELSSIGGAHASWETPVDAYFRLTGGKWQLVGFTRIPEA